MSWKPKISETDNFPEKLEEGLFYSLSRLTSFRSESKIVKVFDEINISHGDCLCSPYGEAFRGEECWSEERRRKYKKENGENRSALIPAYRGSEFEKSNTFDFSVSWSDCDFYIEGVSGAAPIISQKQAKMDQMERSTLLGLLILSKGEISSIRPIKYYKQPKMGATMLGMGGHHLNESHAVGRKTFVLTRENESTLVDLATQIFNRKHSEAYLASLRLMRAINRLQLDDGIVDLVIGLEALFNGTKDPGISLRVSQRLSRILDQKKSQRRGTNGFVKKAYGMRSNLVHGTRRQIEFLEEILGSTGKRKGKPLELNELREMKEQLVHLVCSALLARYTTHKDLTQEELFKYLDDKAI